MSPRMANARLVSQLNRITVDHFYGDTANILKFTRTSYDGFGQPVGTTASTPVACSFKDLSSLQGGRTLEKWKPYADISQIAAEIRWQGSPTPAKDDQVVLTGRFDSSDFTDVTYEIIGIQDRDVFGFLCALAKVTI